MIRFLASLIFVASTAWATAQPLTGTFPSIDGGTLSIEDWRGRPVLVVNTASRAGAMWRENLDEVKALMALNRDDLATFIADRNIDPTRAYNLSKEAVIVMTMARTEEMIGRGLRMNSASPAAVNTGILQDFAAAFGERMAKNVARAGRAGTPGEIADIIVFLASPESNWIKGQDICIDGGMSAMAGSDIMGLAGP